MMGGHEKRSTAGESERERERKRTKRDDAAEDLENKSLYICSYEEYGELGQDSNARYLVHAIKLRDLFVFPDPTAMPITIYPSKSKYYNNKSDNSKVLLREVASVGADDKSKTRLPIDMGVGVFGSRIVLAGGSFMSPLTVGSFRTPSYILDTADPNARFDSSVIPPIDGDRMHFPYVQEVHGKLYLLSAGEVVVLDSDNKVWTPLEPPPKTRCVDSLSCFVLDTMIFATNPYRGTFCFDVAAPPESSWTRISPLLVACGNPVVLDCENEFEKLVLTCHSERHILVFHMKLDDKYVPVTFETVAVIDLPKLPGLSDRCLLTSFCGAKFEDGIVCFSFLFTKDAGHSPLLVLAFQCAYSDTFGVRSTPEMFSSSTTDPSYLNCTSISGSFFAKALGYRLFEYDLTERSSIPTNNGLRGCFVL